jgi:Domain of unknown function (DUF4328)
MNPLKYNGQRAKIIFLLFFVVLAAHTVNIFGSYLQIQLLKEFEAGDVDMAKADANDLRQQMIAVFMLVANVLVIIYFIRWLRRAYNNLIYAGGSTMFTEGWAAGSWFVPFLNLVRPYQIMREVWTDTQELNKSKVEKKSSTLVGVWWAVYLCSNIFSSITSRMMANEQEISGLIRATYADMYASAFEIIAAGITMLMIKQTAAFEESLYQYMENPINEGEDLLGNIAVEY